MSIPAACSKNKHQPSLFGADLPHAAPGARIGLLGGSFNPPHEGHLLIAREALKRLALQQVWLLVSPGNPLKANDQQSPLAARLQATRALARDRRIITTDFEAHLPTNYTADTVTWLKQRFPSVRFVWLMGADNLAAIHTWYNWQTIFTTLPIAVFERPGHRLKAMAGKAAKRFFRQQIPPKQRRALVGSTPPAWVYLNHPTSPLSSTELRQNR